MSDTSRPASRSRERVLPSAQRRHRVPPARHGQSRLCSARAAAPWGEQQPRNPLIAATPLLPLRRRPSLAPRTHPTAPAPVEAALRAAGPQAQLNIAADLLTSLPGRQRRVSTHFFHLWFPGFLRKGEAVGGSNRHPRARATAPSSLFFPGRGGCQRGPLSLETAAWLAGSALCSWPSTPRPSWVRQNFLPSRVEGAPECCLPGTSSRVAA